MMSISLSSHSTIVSKTLTKDIIPNNCRENMSIIAFPKLTIYVDVYHPWRNVIMRTAKHTHTRASQTLHARPDELGCRSL